jgi:hypothetical protein
VASNRSPHERRLAISICRVHAEASSSPRTRDGLLTP